MGNTNTDNDYIDESGIRNVKCRICGDWACSHYDANVPLVLCGDCGEPCCNACATDDAATICKVCVAKKANLEEMPVKELRERARGLGITYVSERKKAELIAVIRHEEKVATMKPDPTRKVIGRFLDGSFIYEATR